MIKYKKGGFFMKLLILLIVIIYFIFNTLLSILNYRNRNAEIPEEVKDVYDEVSYKKWHQYNMENFRFSIVTSFIDLVILLLLLIFNIFAEVHHLAQDWTQSVPLQSIIIIGFYIIVDYVVTIFTSYYGQFVIEEKYGFNKMTIKTFIFDKIKSLILIIIIGGGIIYGLSNLYIYNPDMFYLYAIIAAVLFIFIFNILYTKVFVRIFNKLTPLEEGELKNKIIEYSQSVGYEISKISMMDASKRSSKLNAFFTGFGKFKHIVLYDTLVEKMTPDQIVSVLAHEIGHAKKRHTLQSFFFNIITIAINILVLSLCIKSNELGVAFGFNGANFGFGAIIFILLLQPISLLFDIILNPISRKFEYQADAFAVKYWPKEHLIDALKILGRENFSNLTPHPLYVAIKYSHPPLDYRIKAILKYKE